MPSSVSHSSSSSQLSLARSLFNMTWPLLFGVLALMSYQLVDAAWIAILGVQELAALGFTLPVIQLLMGIQIGLGIATTAIISPSLGAGKQQLARQQGAIILLVGASVLASLYCLAWLLQTPILNFLGAEAELRPLIASYWLPALLSSWLGAVVYLGYSQHRAYGYAKFTGLVMVLVSLLNLLLDPLFIFTFNLGLPGAAWATLASFTIGGLLTFPRLVKQQMLCFQLATSQLGKQIAHLINLSLPAALSQLMPGMAALLATGLVASFGSAAVAAWGLGARLEMFSLVVVLALTMALPPMLGRYKGAEAWQEVEQLVKLAVKFVLLWQFALAIFWLALRYPLTGLLTQDAVTAEIIQNYLLKMPFSYAPLGVCMLMVSVCNALGLPLRALIISFVRLFVCYLPLLYLGAYLGEIFALGGIYSLFTAALIGNFFAGIFAWLGYKQGLKHLKLNLS